MQPIICLIALLNDKLVAILTGLFCLEEGETPPWTPANPGDPIACQLKAIFDMACLAADQVVCEGAACVACFVHKGYDYENSSGFWGSGAFQATVNGVATSTPWAFAGTEPKSQGYQAMIDQINATPGWTVTITDDPTMATNDLVGWRFNYSGPCGDPAILTIERQGGDSIVLDANTGTGTFTDSGGNEISNGRQPTACG